MRADPLTIGALTICGIAWLVAAAVLTLDLLGRLPGARKANARVFRMRRTAGLTLMTALVLLQVGDLERWATPIRRTLAILTLLAGIGTLAAVIKAAAIMSEAKRTQAAMR